MPTGTLTTDCHLTAGVNIRVKHRCSKLSVYGDRISGEKYGCRVVWLDHKSVDTVDKSNNS